MEQEAMSVSSGNVSGSLPVPTLHFEQAWFPHCGASLLGSPAHSEIFQTPQHLSIDSLPY